MSNKIYCGNNKYHKGKKGSPYQCLRKGIGIGIHLPLNKDYIGKYKSIDKPKLKIFCGKSTTPLPVKHRRGNCTECLRQGVGIGLSITAKKYAEKMKNKKRKKSKKSKRKNIRQKKKSKRKKTTKISKKK